MKRCGKALRAPQGAGDQRNIGGKQGAQAIGHRYRVFRINIKLAVANAGFNARTRMADQEYLHNKPQ